MLDASGVAPSIEAALPTGGRPRQLRVRTLILGILLALADARPAHLRRIHAALLALPDPDRWRLGVITPWRAGPHLLTYRQVERTYGLIVAALSNDTPDGAPSQALAQVVDALVEASIPAEWKGPTALAVDWTDHESFARPPLGAGGTCADPEASWGHRRGDGPGQAHEAFYGYYLSAATMVKEEGGAAVPELVRRITATACHRDPVVAMVPVLSRLAASGVGIGDILADSGYAHRAAANWALPLRRLGARLVVELHPNDRGPKGTFAGAVIANGNLYCPATPTALLALGPLARTAGEAETAAHDRTSATLARYKLARISSDDAEGYHRVTCPAVAGKLRCPLREDSMRLPFSCPEVLTPPQHRPTCCVQRTVTVPPAVSAKTAQAHDYPSQAHRASYARRSAAERAFSTVKDPATTDLCRGWCRLMGLSAITLLIACAFVVRNTRILDAFEARRAEDQRRAATGMPPKIRKRRRRTLTDLLAASAS